jgi:hypothetical protein
MAENLTSTELAIQTIYQKHESELPVTFRFITAMSRARNYEPVPWRSFSVPFPSRFFQTKWKHVNPFHKPLL